MARQGERRGALSVRLAAADREALKRRVAAAAKAAEKQNLKAPTESDVARWLLADARERRPLNWIPQEHGLLPVKDKTGAVEGEDRAAG